MDHFELLSKEQNDQKYRLIDRLELYKKRLWSNLEAANEALENVNQAASDVNEAIQAVNEWIKSIRKEKSETFSALPENEVTVTMRTELHCYNQKFQKIRVKVPEAFDYEEIESINEILVQFDEMP